MMRKARFGRLPPLPVRDDGVIAGHGAATLEGEHGINLFAYFRGRFGLAEAARSYARALLSAGAPVALNDIALDLPHDFEDTSLDAVLSATAPFDVGIVFVNPDYLDMALSQIGAERLAERRLVACWFWELERVPDAWLEALHRVDAIVVASSFVENAFRRVTDKPICRVPLPLLDDPDSGAGRASFGLDPADFVFLTAFDFHSWIERKNPYAVIDAFCAAFPRGDESARLLIKTSNGEQHPDAFSAVVRAMRADSRIILRDDILETAHLRALQRCCDAYVSLHRAEGFGLGLAECMGQGKPVIATAWSGNMEFMTADNSCLVGYRMVEVPSNGYLHPEAQQWAEPVIAEAAGWMRRLFDDRALAAAIGQRARHDVGRDLAPAKAAQTLLAFVQRVRRGAAGAGITGRAVQ